MSTDESKKEKGRLLRIGLSTGQQIVVLTTEEVEDDLDVWVITAVGGDLLTIKKDAVIFTRRTEIDMPTDEEVEAYVEGLKSQQGFIDPDDLKPLMDGAYL